MDAMRGTLLEISHGIHANPELAFEEYHAHRLLTGAIRDAGLAGGRVPQFYPKPVWPVAGRGDLTLNCPVWVMIPVCRHNCAGQLRPGRHIPC